MLKADRRLAEAMKGVGLGMWKYKIANSQVTDEEEQASTTLEGAAEAPSADQLQHHEQQQRFQAIEAACAQLQTGLSEVACQAERTEGTGQQLQQEVLALREQLGADHGFRQEWVRSAIQGGSTEAEAGGGPPPQSDHGLTSSDLSQVVFDLQEALLVQRSELANLLRHMGSLRHLGSAVENCLPECRVEDGSSECGTEAASSLVQQPPTVGAECGHGKGGAILARLESLEVKSAALRCNDMALCALKERMDELAFLQGDLNSTRQDVTELHWRVRYLEDRSTLSASKLDKAPSDNFLQSTRNGHDVTMPEAVGDLRKDASTTIRQETKLEEAMVRLSTFCKELSAVRTDPGTATVEERALAADAAVKSKLDDVRGLLSSCLHHLRQGNTAATVGETTVIAAGNVKRGASTSVTVARSADAQRRSPSAGAGNRRPLSQSAGQHAPIAGEQRRPSPSRRKEQQGRSQSCALSPLRSQAPGSPGGSGSQPGQRRPSAHAATREVKDERRAMSPARVRGRSTSIPLESHNPVASTPAPLGRVRHMSSSSSTTAIPTSGVPAGGSSVVTAAANRRVCITVSRGGNLSTSTAKH